MKKKIAVLTTGWSIDFVNDILEGIKIVTDLNDTDIYTFVCYKFIDQTQQVNTTGYNIFSLINYEEYDGAIILGNIFDNNEGLEKERQRILKAGIPAVSILKNLKGLDFIDCDETEGFFNLLQHTYDVHGLKNYAYIGGPDNDIQSQLRYETFKRFLSANNLEYKPEQVFLNGDYTSNFATHTAIKIFSNPEHLPDIIVCVNDFSAIATIAEANNFGLKVPEDIKVIGFDNIDFSGAVNPSISTCDNRTKLMGYLAALRVLNKKPDDTSVSKQIISSRPIFRQSCGCQKKETDKQKNYLMKRLKTMDDSEILASQLRHFEDFFMIHDNTTNLFSDLADFFQNRHYFEGRTFGIMLKKAFVESFESGNFQSFESDDFGDTMISSVIMKNDELQKPKEFPTQNIIPEELESSETSFYIIFPIVSSHSIFGYLVCKDNKKLLEKKRAYTWLKNFANNFSNLQQRITYKLTSEKYLYLSTQDALSGVLNRTGYDNFAVKLYADNCAKGRNTSIVFIDINSMKYINDAFGHLQGDFAVKTIASAIIDSKPSGWLAIRYGGDEFVVVGCSDLMSGEDFCNKFKENLDIMINKMQLPYPLSASTGSKEFTPDLNITLDEAVAQVDKIMYINKRLFHKNIEK